MMCPTHCAHCAVNHNAANIALSAAWSSGDCGQLTSMLRPCFDDDDVVRLRISGTDKQRPFRKGCPCCIVARRAAVVWFCSRSPLADPHNARCRYDLHVSYCCGLARHKRVRSSTCAASALGAQQALGAVLSSLHY